MANPNLHMNPQMEQIIGEIRDKFRTLADGFQKLDKIEDSIRQSRLLEDLTQKMIDCKRLIEKFDGEIEMEESKSPVEVSQKLKDEKQSMIKALNSYMSFIKIYQNILGNKKVELFITEAGNSEPTSEEKSRVSSEMLIRELNLSGNKTMNEMDRAIEPSKKVVYEPVILGIQNPDTLKRQVSIKMESPLLKETGRHVSTHNPPNNSPLLSGSKTPQLQRTTQMRKHTIKNKGKGKEDVTSRFQKKWSLKEMTWLAKCFCDTSENRIVGNSLKKTNFWGTVKEKFNDNECGWERMEDSLSSKWRDVNKACTKFFPIFKDIKDQWCSGSNDDDIYDAAIISYQNQYTKIFNMKETFFILMQHPKWNVPDDPVGKGRDDFENVGDSQHDVVSLSQDFENELFGNMPIPRPMGRERAKKAAKSSTFSDAAVSSRDRSSGLSRVVEFIDNITRYKDVSGSQRNIALDKFTEYVSIQTALSCMEVLEKSTANMPDPRDARRLENLKKLVRRKLKDDLNIDDNEDDN